MLQFILWYLTITLLGLLSFPLAHHLFPALADRGYSLSRALGLLVWGFIFWLSVSLGLAQNNPGGLLFALAILAGLSAWSRWRSSENANRLDLAELGAWFKENRRYVLTVEALFLAAFAAWAFVRANNPEFTSAGGEKWMEVAFINAILRSPAFPPHDPWLSGYGISYYYFGYVMTAMLAMFTATAGSLAHNLMLSLIFALSVLGASGLLYNLLSAYWGKGGSLRATIGALLAPLFLVLIGNLEGVLELLHAYGIGWKDNAPNFWTWLNMKDLNVAPSAPLGWHPRYWFWWRASRVLHDYDLNGNFNEIIDEFPFFSYLLGDLHPHVLAMPFGLLAAGMALNVFLGGWKGTTNIFGFKLPLRADGFLFSAVALGGLSFLNTWDFPVYLALVVCAFALFLVRERGWQWDILEDILRLAIPLAVVSVILYLPFYVGFASQAGGILPNILFPTRGAYMWIMFGTLLIPMFLHLLSLAGNHPANWKTGFSLTGGLVLLLAFFSIVLGLAASQTQIGQDFIANQGVSSAGELLRAALLRRVEMGAGLLTLILLVGGGASYLAGTRRENEPRANNPLLPFVFLVIIFGGLLVLAPEFVYLRDQFGWRMNTVFKFYYQAWILWSVAASFGAAVLLSELRGARLALASVLISLTLAAGLTFTALALPEKTSNFQAENPTRRTLDGSAYLSAANPDEFAGIQWLTHAPLGVVAEAVGGSYTEYARVSTYSGQPTVIGWPGHESQWRGGYAEMGSRQDDIIRLYTTASWNAAKAIIERYNIRYIFIGQLERTTYTVNEIKFANNLVEAFRQGQVVIYQVP